MDDYLDRLEHVRGECEQLYIVSREKGLENSSCLLGSLLSDLARVIPEWQFERTERLAKLVAEDEASGKSRSGE